MKIYLASRYSRHPEMREVASILTKQGHTITSRWISGDQDDDPEAGTDSHRERVAIEDLEDVMKADILLSFTEEPGKLPKGARPSKGGRHVEFGVGVAMNLRTVVIGPRENVFHWLPTVEVYDDLETFLDMLETEEV